MGRNALAWSVLFSLTVVVGVADVSAESWRDKAIARGMKLPSPFGVGLSFLTQDQDYAIDTLVLGIDTIDPAVASNLKIANDTETYHFTADYWVLPFLDLYGIVGQVDGSTRVNLSTINIGLPLQDLDIRYDGWLYGAGAVFAYGGEHVFGTLDVSYSWTSLDVSTSSVEAFVVTPRFGYAFEKTSVWIGAMYQKPEERHQGAVVIPGLGPVPYDVTLQAKDEWNYTAGLSTDFGEHWVLSLEGGFGPRTMGLAHLGYRF